MQKGTITYEDFQRMVRLAPPNSGINAKSIAASIEKKGYTLPPELSSYSSVQPQEKSEGKEGFFASVGSAIQKRKQQAFGTDTGLATAALNPVQTSKTDSAAGRFVRGEQGLGETALQVGGAGAGLIGDITGAGVTAIGRGADYLSGGNLSKGMEAVAGSEVGQFVGGAAGNIAEQYQKFKTMFPKEARNLESIVNIASLIPLPRAAQATVKAGGSMLPAKAIKAGVAQTDDLAKAGKETLEQALQSSNASRILRGAQSEQAKVGFLEKIAGVRPDIKKRIAGKADKLKEYFDVADARNLDDTVPTPLEFAARKVEQARSSLQKELTSKGSEIGAFRETIATTPVTNEGIKTVRNEFVNQLDKLNLTLNNKGQIVRKAKVVKKASDSEVKLLQSLFDDFQTLRQNPTMQNLIDLRNSFDDQINFAKQAREASNVVDPLSRSVRGAIKKVNEKAIGPAQAKKLSEYSDLSSLLKEMNQVVDSKSGGEFLLKRVLSERGRIPRELMQKVKDITGVDLMDDAVMAQIATDIIGNSAQKGLFRQEIAKSGLDILDVISGSPSGMLKAGKMLMSPVMDRIAPAKETFLKAAQ